MSKTTRYMRIGAFALPIVFIACVLEQSCVTAVIDHVAFQVSAPEATTSDEAISETMMIPLRDGRKVEARWVHGARANPRTYTVILFNGIGGSLSDWGHVQEKLCQRGISSVAFNYGDVAEIGQPRGKSRLRDVQRVTNVIIEKIKAQNGSGSYFLLGHSLGSAVVLQAYQNLDTKSCAGVILCNPFSSLKAWAIYHHHLPNILSFVMPPYYDNVQNIKRISKPVLIVTSHADTVNPPEEALEIYHAAHEPKSIKMFERPKHNHIFSDNSDEYWQPIFAFVEQSGKHD